MRLHAGLIQAPATVFLVNRIPAMCVLVRGRDIQQIRSSSILIKLIVSNSVLVTTSKALVTRSDALVPSSLLFLFYCNSVF